MHVFGLTGGLASGKSTVSARFLARGVPVIDADALAREVVCPGSEGLADVVAAFGRGVLARDGSLDRSALARQVFGDAGERRRLEAILHPRIHALMQARTAELERAGTPIACYEAPLLVEVGLADELRPLVVVSAPAAQQVQRATARSAQSEAEARARLAAQLPLADKVAAADVVIDNSGSLDELAERADAALDEVLRRVGLSPGDFPRRPA